MDFARRTGYAPCPVNRIVIACRRHHASAARLFAQALRQVQDEAGDLPATAAGLADWMHRSAEQASTRYRAYLEARRASAPRRYFTNRAHTLHFLQVVAPTKLVDGA